jgi:hypothetical protein
MNLKSLAFVDVTFDIGSNVSLKLVPDDFIFQGMRPSYPRNPDKKFVCCIRISALNKCGISVLS